MAEKGLAEALCVGLSTVTSMWADRFLPGLLDRYLAQKGWAAQQTDQPEDPERLGNLWQPVPGPYGARGAFDEQAHESSSQLWLAERKWWGLGLFAAASAALGAVRSLGKQR